MKQSFRKPLPILLLALAVCAMLPLGAHSQVRTILESQNPAQKPKYSLVDPEASCLRKRRIDAEKSRRPFEEEKEKAVCAALLQKNTPEAPATSAEKKYSVCRKLERFSEFSICMGDSLTAGTDEGESLSPSSGAGQGRSKKPPGGFQEAPRN